MRGGGREGGVGGGPGGRCTLTAGTYGGSGATECYGSRGFNVVQHSAVEAAEIGMSRDYSTVVLEKS